MNLLLIQIKLIYFLISPLSNESSRWSSNSVSVLGLSLPKPTLSLSLSSTNRDSSSSTNLQSNSNTKACFCYSATCFRTFSSDCFYLASFLPSHIMIHLAACWRRTACFPVQISDKMTFCVFLACVVFRLKGFSLCLRALKWNFDDLKCWKVESLVVHLWCCFCWLPSSRKTWKSQCFRRFVRHFSVGHSILTFGIFLSSIKKIMEDSVPWAWVLCSKFCLNNQTQRIKW